jgi:enterochelin esterase-like enzyme
MSTLTQHEIVCGDTGITRKVHVALPDQRSFGDCPLLFCTDGQFMDWFFAEANQGRRNELGIVIIGVNNDPENRAGEYVNGRNNDAFAQHEAYFSQVVYEWSINQFGLTRKREKTAVFGFSCGGCFATLMAIRYPEKYCGAIPMSVAGRPVRFDLPESEWPDLSDSRFFLCAGASEPQGMKKYMKRMNTWLIKRGAECRFTVERGDHNIALWSENFVPAVRWMFNETVRQQTAPQT